MWTVQIIDKFTNEPLNAYVDKNHEIVKVLTKPCEEHMIKFDKIGDCMRFCVDLMDHQFEPQFDNFPEFKAKVYRIS